jgi:hypothetical protein
MNRFIIQCGNGGIECASGMKYEQNKIDGENGMKIKLYKTSKFIV